MTPLHLSSKKGRADMVSLLIGAGARLDAQDEVSSLWSSLSHKEAEFFLVICIEQISAYSLLFGHRISTVHFILEPCMATLILAQHS